MKRIIYILIFFLITVVIARGQSSFSGERLQKACSDFVYNILGDDIELRISKSIREQSFEEKGVTARCSATKESLRGNCFVGIEFLFKGKIIKRLQVPARVIIYKDVPVAIDNIPVGNVIYANDISFQKKDVTYQSDKDIPTINEIAGQKASRNISKGNIITRAFIEEQGTIKRGDKVNVIVQSGTVIIRTTGQAMNDAAVGKSIRVKREGTQTILDGLVAMDGTIFISLK
jgi:flagellar basal body P-ring formation protein FlgA